MKTVHIVYGPPLAGKSTFVRENMGPDDLVFDMDAVQNALCYGADHAGKPHTLGAAIALRKGKKVNEGAANDDFKDTKIAVELTGNDFSATCTLSYAAATMSIDALEAFIVQDMADQVGNAMAADLMTTIKGAINTENKLTAASTTVFTFAELCSLFGSLKRCRRMVAYVNNATLYKQLVALVDAQGRPIFQQTAQEGAQGAIIGAVIHLEDEAGENYPEIIKAAGLNGFTASKPATDTAHELKTIKAGPMSAGDYKKHTAALAADGIAWEDC